MGLIYLCEFRHNTFLNVHKGHLPIAFDCETDARAFWGEAYPTFVEPEFVGGLTGPGTTCKVKVYGVFVGTITVVECRKPTT